MHKWTTEELREAAAHYKTKTEFKTGNPKAYDRVIQRKLMDIVGSHFPAIHMPHKKWDATTLKLEALKYTSRTEFQDKAQRAYQVARQLKILDDVCAHMPSNFTEWTKDKVLQEASKFTSRGAYFLYGRAAYYGGKKLGIHEEVCHHMETPKETSLGQEEMSDFIRSLGLEVIDNYKDLSGGLRLEIDCYIPELRLGFEYNGVEYHSEVYKDRNYHVDKKKYFKDLDITVFMIYSDEWEKKKLIVKSLIRAKCKKLNVKYHARKGAVQRLSMSQANDFFTKNHLMGGSIGMTTLGLVLDGRVIACLAYRRLGDGVDISRFATELNTVCPGALSKLLAAMVKSEQPASIQSYVDLRYGDGASLTACGFRLVDTTLGWRWTDGYKTYNRLQCRANMDDRKLSEKDHAAEKGLCRIYDCGQAKFIQHLSKIDT